MRGACLCLELIMFFLKKIWKSEKDPGFKILSLSSGSFAVCFGLCLLLC